ncbi:S-adenosyl-L-methionine-dependent methyltransferase [Sphaerosporella brunnea]|uniref:S-adenosyl-L-methionine-dependent methyltransferase n=1 Tax=Sphaerosporella brunnea TaxID=1250544 RepID=A0A5J5EDT3_9PEZI|nr:S-adenosyl-L-methionine-dependent methyltransferase [Sphaerosporella brunnea]
MSSQSPSRPPDKELRALAKKAQKQPPRSSLPALDFSIGYRIPAFARAALYLIAAAAGSYVSQLTLAPVYGEIPSSLYHDKIVTGIFFAAWLLKGLVRKFPFRLSAVVPVLVLLTPGLLNFIFRYSTQWGAVDGPLYTEALTYYPVLFLSVYTAATLLEFNNWVLDAIPASISFAIFSIARSTIPDLLRNHIGSSWVLTRCGLHHALGALYAILSPSLLLATTITGIFHSMNENPMCVLTPTLNETLAPYNHSIIARQESNTGYISVLDNFEAGYRVLRCDHSLLGGEWQRAPAGFEHMNHAGFKEPIYAIFVIMEAVRLIEPAPKNPNPRALAIGLGIGTSADALIKHGVETDIVELDPVVYRYAKDYFGLSPNHTAYIEDAVGFVKREVAKGADSKKYDYILHDVFTGGAVPASLFTFEVFRGLRHLLSDDGVIAINWAGDLKLQAARSIIETVRAVFNNCRVFREEMPSEDVAAAAVDFTNMVVFCTKAKTPYQFRAPKQEDFLGSYARQRFLVPRYEIDLEKYWAASGQGDYMVLDESNISTLDAWQKLSAVGHWGVIRTVVPDGVWENY